MFEILINAEFLCIFLLCLIPRDVAFSHYPFPWPIHVLPLQFNEGDARSLNLDHTKPVTIDIASPLKPMGKAEMEYTDKTGKKSKTGLTVRLDTPVEVEYFQSGGILNFVLKRFVS